MRKSLLSFLIVTMVSGALLAVSCSAEAPKESFLSLATGEKGTTLDAVLDKFGKPEFALATDSRFVKLWYRVPDKECSRYGGFVGSCHVALKFSAAQDCDTSNLSCHRLKQIHFPVLVQRISSNWLSEQRQDFYEYSNPPEGPQTKQEFPGGDELQWRTDFPEPLPQLKSALGLY